MNAGKDKNAWSDLIAFSATGFQLMVTIVSFAGLGYLTDKYFKTTQLWWTLGASIIGCVLSVYMMIKKYQKEFSNKK
jgi:F0F1-type ATP synthase assembly protein I